MGEITLRNYNQIDAFLSAYRLLSRIVYAEGEVIGDAFKKEIKAWLEDKGHLV